MYDLHVMREGELVLSRPLEQHLFIGTSPSCDLHLPGAPVPAYAHLEMHERDVLLKGCVGDVLRNGEPVGGTVALDTQDTVSIAGFEIQLHRLLGADEHDTRDGVPGRRRSPREELKDVTPGIVFTIGRKRFFCQSSIVIGRGTSCDLVIPQNPKTQREVSRRHVELRRRNGCFYATDLQSRNGTTLFDEPLDGQPLPRTGILRLGRYELPYEIEDPMTWVLSHEGIRIPSLNPNLPPTMLRGSSPPMQTLLENLDRALMGDQTVLLLGENGTGKDLCARYLHFYHSKRGEGPFIAVNCAAIPRELAESYLFGHKKGAFTGAVDNSEGVFEQAHGGTLFLDEVGELPVELQAQLLRVLEEKLVRPVGSQKAKPVDVRVIFATNRDIDEAMQLGRFREDLFYRCQSCIRVPPLRERPGDIKLLADAFLGASESSLQLTPRAYRALIEYSWPGNVRQLASTIEQSIIRAPHRGSTAIDASDLELDADIMAFSKEIASAQAVSLKEQILRMLKTSYGNVLATAKKLHMGRMTLYRRMEDLNIDPGMFRR